VIGDEPAHISQGISLAFGGAAGVLGGEWGGLGLDHRQDRREPHRVLEPAP
jgi:hypothetical protein